MIKEDIGTMIDAMSRLFIDAHHNKSISTNRWYDTTRVILRLLH